MKEIVKFSYSGRLATFHTHKRVRCVEWESTAQCPQRRAQRCPAQMEHRWPLGVQHWTWLGGVTDHGMIWVQKKNEHTHSVLSLYGNDQKKNWSKIYETSTIFKIPKKYVFLNLQWEDHLVKNKKQHKIIWLYPDFRCDLSSFLDCPSQVSRPDYAGCKDFLPSILRQGLSLEPDFANLVKLDWH